MAVLMLSGRVAAAFLGTSQPGLWSRYKFRVTHVREYCLIVEGAYLSETEAEHALRDPFIEDWVEQTGRFRIHNMDEIQIAPGVTLGSLGVVMLDDRVFEIASTDPDHPLTEHKAKGVAEALRRQDMFDEVRTEPRSEEQYG
ncbi:MAG: hypothetical protein ABR555_10680 [Pyrinomonadaceae bacterium]